MPGKRTKRQWCTPNIPKSVKKKVTTGQVGTITKENLLNIAFININGLNFQASCDVQTFLDSQSPHVLCILETKKNSAQTVDTVQFQDYTLIENSRTPEQKYGGGLNLYYKSVSGCKVKHFNPSYNDPNLEQILTERTWISITSNTNTTSICFVYLACQHSDNRNAQQNANLYNLLLSEQKQLRQKGHRIVFCGDMNAHVGNIKNIGTTSNHPVNTNGQLLLDFVNIADMKIVNTLCREEGDCKYHNCNRICKGVYTWNRGLHSSIIDYVLVSEEHSSCIQSMFIDDNGLYSFNSDHNLVQLSIRDDITHKKIVNNDVHKKPVWNITNTLDWSLLTREIDESVIKNNVDKSNVNVFASSLGNILYNAMTKVVGFKKPHKNSSYYKLPDNIVKELKYKKYLSTQVKLLCNQYQRDKVSIPNISPNTCFREHVILLDKQKDKVNSLIDTFNEATELLNEHRKKVDKLFNELNKNRRKFNIKKCSGKDKFSIRNFWKFVSNKNTKSAVISMVINEKSGKIHTDINEIVNETEMYIKMLFNGSFDSYNSSDKNVPPSDHNYNDTTDDVTPPPSNNNHCNSDHEYAIPVGPQLKSFDDSNNVYNDPIGFMNSDFTINEISEAIKLLSCDKAKGVDDLPNECIMYSPPSFVALLLELFNTIKNCNSFPIGWSHGRVVLIHKSGPKEFLTNYRPLTVNIAFVGVYSRILNNRMSNLVETHDLLGESQNGFRPGRSSGDNSFILNTILWKAKCENKNVHVSYIDIQKAYDSVNREKLWQILERFGFTDTFIGCIKNLYNNDYVTSSVNGIKTKPIYLSRGVRQGCSLSPLLFALYLTSLSMELDDSKLGFVLHGKVISALLFADDLVVMARTEKGLKTLINIVLKHCYILKLTVSTKKK